MNSILKETKGRNAFFMKMQNKTTYKISGAVFPLLLRLKALFSESPGPTGHPL